jgi:hypothetical protein
MLQAAEDKNPGREPRGQAQARPEAIVRWTPWRKLYIVVAVRNGKITAQEACDRHNLSHEELTGWIEGYDRAGLAGLQQKRGRRSPR